MRVRHLRPGLYLERHLARHRDDVRADRVTRVATLLMRGMRAEVARLESVAA